MSVAYSRQVLFGTLLIFLLPMLISLYLLHKRRNLYPLRGRMPLLVMITNILFILYFIILISHNLSLSDNRAWPCVVIYVLTHSTEVALFNIYLIRCYNLYIRYKNATLQLSKITSLIENNELDELKIPIRNSIRNSNSNEGDAVGEIMLLDSSTINNNNNNNNNYSRINRTKTDSILVNYAMKDKKAAKVFGISLLITYIPMIFLLIFDDELHGGYECNFGVRPIVTMTLLFVIVCLYIPVVIQLRNIRDEFYIKEEFNYVWICGVACVVITLILGQPVNDFNAINYSHYVTCWMVIISYSLSTFLPLYRSYVPKKMKISYQNLRPPEEYKSLHDTLQDNDACELFRAYLKKELCVENLLFLEAVNDFKAKFSNDNLVKNLHIINKIYKNFIEVDSEFEINISYEMRAEIEQTLNDTIRHNQNKTPNSHSANSDKLKNIFNDAWAELFELLQGGPFVRFLQSKEFESIVLGNQRKQSIINVGL